MMQVYVAAVSPHSGDINRGSLQCGRRLYDVTMSENNPISATIVKVGVPGSDVTFALDDAEDAFISGLVHVHATTGIVSSRASLDRERIDSISFGVVATEAAAASGSRSVTCHVHVTVADVNDNAPVFEFPSPENNTIVLTTGDRYDGTAVARLVARDADFGTNARVTYSIEAGTPLAVDPATGLVSVVGNLDSLVAQKANIRVVATDSGNPAMSTTGVLTLVLEHSEVHTPHRDQTSRRRAADRKTGTGSNFWLIMAVGAVIVVAAFIITAIVAVLVFTDRRRRGQKRDLPEPTSLPVVGGGNTKHDDDVFHGANGDVKRSTTAAVPASSIQKLQQVRLLCIHYTPGGTCLLFLHKCRNYQAYFDVADWRQKQRSR